MRGSCILIQTYNLFTEKKVPVDPAQYMKKEIITVKNRGNYAV